MQAGKAPFCGGKTFLRDLPHRLLRRLQQPEPLHIEQTPIGKPQRGDHRQRYKGQGDEGVHPGRDAHGAGFGQDRRGLLPHFAPGRGGEQPRRGGLLDPEKEAARPRKGFGGLWLFALRPGFRRGKEGQSITVLVRPMPTTAAVIFFQVLQPQMPSAERPTRRW